MTSLRIVLAIALAVGIGFAALGQRVHSHRPQSDLYGEPRLPNDDGATLNWSGYAVFGGEGDFDNVRGSWTQPSVKCSGDGRQISSHWIGIDGYGSETVQQIGTGVECRKGKPLYYAWFEFYPSPSRYVETVSVKPGDEFSAEVQSAGQRFTLTLTNLTSGESFKTSRVVADANKSSAEWVTESGSVRDEVVPLTNFGSMRFNGAVATMNGITKPIDYDGWVSQQLLLVNKAGQVLAETSSLSSNGKSFKVTWARH
jgi:hypothetical protein